MEQPGKSVELFERIVRTVPVYRNGQETNSQNMGWLLCHGYGQRADHLLRKWDQVGHEEHRLFALEAPHRFYWEGVTGRPVASWMTSRLRTEDIQDNNNYLDKMHKKHIAGMSRKGLFGFSQGGTTIWRWIHDRKPEFDIFINYAGWIPEDIDLTILDRYLKNKTLVFVYGDKDQYLTADRIQALTQIAKQSTLDIYFEIFKGDHRIDREVLQGIIQKYVDAK